MPESSYLWLHRDAKLNAQDRIELCAWAEQQRDLLRQQMEE